MSSEADEKRAELHLRLSKVVADFYKGIDSIRAGINHPMNEVNLPNAEKVVGTLEELNAEIFKNADTVMVMLMDLSMKQEP